MSTVNYFAYGYEKDILGDPNREATYIFLFNPTKHDSEVTATIYYEDPKLQPSDFKCSVPSEGRTLVLGWSKIGKNEVRKNARFGAKLISTEPIIAELGMGSYWPEDDWKTRDMNFVMGAPALSKVWYHAYGYSGYPKADNGLKETFYAYILNPSKKDAEVAFTVYYTPFLHGPKPEDRDATKPRKSEYKVTVPAEHMKAVLMDEFVIFHVRPRGKSRDWSTRFVSSEPVCIEYECAAWRVGNPLMMGRTITMCRPWPLKLYEIL